MLSKQQLFQLQQYTSEAIYREETRQQKLEALQKILEEAEQKTESSWKQLVNDDILLTKIAALEIQLATYAKSATPDKMRDELLQMTEDRVKFELNTKDIIRRLEDEKTETAMRLQDAERSLVQTEEECIWMRDTIKTLETRLKEMTTVSDAKQAELNTAAQTLHEMEKQREVLEKKLKKVEDRIAEMERVWICPERRGSAPNIVKAINDNWILDTEAVKLIYEACRARLAGQFYDMSSLPYHSPALNALKETTSLPIKSTLELCAAQSSSCTDNNDSEGAEQVITNGTNGETKEKRNRISSSPAPEQTMQNGTHDAEEKKENLDRNQREIKSETPDSIVETLNTSSEIEHYLKENLELQARIKNVEMDLSEARAQVQQKDAELRTKAASLERLETAMKTGSTSTLTSVSQFQGISSSTASAPCTSTGISVSRQKDSMMQQVIMQSRIGYAFHLQIKISENRIGFILGFSSANRPGAVAGSPFRLPAAAHFTHPPPSFSSCKLANSPQQKGLNPNPNRNQTDQKTRVITKTVRVIEPKRKANG
ncbi:hypothetical protein WR25_02523 isoform B [Diploscapter pachys]|uniref:Uncharacterized protein n=1 Tax=Diploscapter pachys TaxID=2018661 RepID=A0A2A2JHC9_9BILA|nr:hypothetical protein WR25_02523 isoform A [Diploscapter pachys]PAV61134.1 hypothetical protein WR25_02523 isoform B [Diploscapter pachys]